MTHLRINLKTVSEFGPRSFKK